MGQLEKAVLRDPPRADGRKRPRRVQKKIDRRAGAMHHSGHLACALARLLAALDDMTTVANVGRAMCRMAGAVDRIASWSLAAPVVIPCGGSVDGEFIQAKTARAEGGTMGRVVDPCQAEPMERIVERVTDHGVITEFERAPVMFR